MKRLKTFIWLLLLACCQEVQAVEFFARRLNSDHGLPDNNVRTLAQDSKGYLWMGTPNGLYRYDGYFFNTYKHADRGSMSLLGNNHVTACYALADGRMLFAGQGGMFSVFDVAQGTFVDISQQEKRRLYAEHRRVTVPAEVSSRFADVLRRGGAVINDNLGNAVVIDNTGLIWHVDRQTGETVSMRVYDEALFPLVNSKKYKVVTSERKGLIWVSTNGCGITVYDRVAKTVQHIRQSSGLVSTNFIQDMCLDKDDNVWVADEFHGVVYLSTAQDDVELHQFAPQDAGLRSNQVCVLRWMPDSTLLIASTLGSVYKADRHMQLSVSPVMTGADVHCVCTDRAGRLWIGSRQHGILSPDGRWYAHDDKNPVTVSANNIYWMLTDHSGRLWVAAENSHLDLAEPQPDGGCHFRHFFGSHFSPRVLCQDTHGVIWVGTDNGLFRFRPEELLRDTSAYECVLSGLTLQYSAVSCIYEDSHHVLWVGTLGGGVYAIDGKSQKTAGHLTTASGLISDEVQSIIEDDAGVMWFATKKGIACYHPQTHTVSYHTDEYHLMRNYYADNCACRLPDGRLAFGTNAGIVVYSPGMLSRGVDGGNGPAVLRQSSLTVTDLLVNGESVSLTGNEVSLAYDQNTLTVRFSTFNFRSATATRFTYCLEGYDKQWSELSVYSFANYKNLSPGKYVLHVKAYDNNAHENAEARLVIVIRHPWWQTWWAYLVYILVAVALGYVIYRQLRTVYNLRRRISIEKELTEYKLVFFTNISHEFRTPLTIIRGAMERIRGMERVPGELMQPLSSMERSTDRMLRLINQLLEFRKMQDGKLRLALEDTDVVAFVKDIFQNFSDMASGKRISYNFLPSVKSYHMPLDRQHMDKIVYNLLSNALKYTPSKGTVTVRLRVGEGGMTLRVEDTGVGIPREKQSQLFQRFMQSSFSNDSIGIGLHLTKALVDVHHGTIRYEENHPQGSVFIVELPADRSAYAAGEFLQQSALDTRTSAFVPHAPYQEVAGNPLNDRRVLIVEDDADVADYVKQLLGRYFVVDVALDGAAALEVLGQHTPDLVVCDIMMPAMNGLELTRRLRNDERTASVPVVLLTALNSDNARLKGVEQGADAYITKPFDPKLLVSTCRQLIEKHDKLRQTFGRHPAAKTVTPPEIIVEERDRHLLDVMNTWLYDHISSPTLSVDELAETMGYRRSVFFKKVKALTGQTPADYIRTLRMQRAAELLRDETVTVAEVCYQVGISDPHYFGKVFKQQFGMSPKKYQQGKGKQQ